MPDYQKEDAEVAASHVAIKRNATRAGWRTLKHNEHRWFENCPYSKIRRMVPRHTLSFFYSQSSFAHPVVRKCSSKRLSNSSPSVQLSMPSALNIVLGTLGLLFLPETWLR